MFRLITYIALGLAALAAAFFGGRYSARPQEEKKKPEEKKADEKKAEAKSEPSAHEQLRERLGKLKDEDLERLMKLLLAQEMADLKKKAGEASAKAA